MKKNIILASILFLGGCAAFNSVTHNVYAPKTAEYVVQKATVENDKFSKTTITQFPEFQPKHLTNYKEVTGISAWSAPGGYFFVRILQKENTNPIMQIYYHTVNSNWGFYHSAIDEEGKYMNFVEINKDVDSGGGIVTTEEHFAININKQYLTKYKGKNLLIKVYGKKDNFVFFLPDWYIDGVLQYLANENNN